MGYTESECKDTQNVDMKQQSEAKYPENEYST